VASMYHSKSSQRSALLNKLYPARLKLRPRMSTLGG
jgi:hypothetical protein